jgi:chloramphenicol O-acetyltransferase
MKNVLDDSLEYIEELTTKYGGNINQFLDEAQNKIEGGKLNYEITNKHDPLR